MTRRFRVRLGARGYDVLVGRGLLARAGSLIRRRLGARRVYAVTAAPVAARHGRAFAASCARAGVAVTWLRVPDGEAAKTWRVAGRLVRALARARAARDAVVVAFGGGSVGDLAGFAAAVYLRGVRVVQVPTTLEAQVDAAVGGKTAVDLPEGKNLAGAFHQPSLVLADPDVLRTLPPRQLRAGLAEVVKHGVIADGRLFRRLERRAGELRRGDPGALEDAVLTSVRIKAAVVARDEREGGVRVILNFGHTAGHALEAAAGFRRLLHGEAVAIGMVAAARLSARRGLCAPGVPERIERLLVALGLPVRPPAGLAARRIAAAAAVDKKGSRGRLKLVLTRRIGVVTVWNAPDARPVLRALKRPGER